MIRFSVPATGRAYLRVFNLLGQQVATLFDDVAEPGRFYKITFDARNYASGVYFYRLQTENRSDVKRLMVVK